MKIVRFGGDSTVLGATSNDFGATYHQAIFNTPSTVQRIFQEKLGQSAVSVFNDGVSGSSIVDWYNGSSSRNMPSFANRLLTPEYQAMHIFVLEVAINDIAANTTVEAFSWYLQQIKDKLEAAGKKLILSTPNPINDPGWEKLRDLQAAIKTFASWYNIPLINHYDVINNSIPNWRNMLCDNAHSSETLYALKGAVAASVIEQYVK